MELGMVNTLRMFVPMAMLSYSVTGGRISG